MWKEGNVTFKKVTTGSFKRLEEMRNVSKERVKRKESKKDGQREREVKREINRIRIKVKVK